MNHRPTSAEFYEGQISYWEDRRDTDNPYLRPEERSLVKDLWNRKAADWDDGWADAYSQDCGIEEDLRS